MSSRAQRRANRQNSKLSTGPKTPKGKLASSRNNVRHGLAGRLIVANLSREEAAEFYELASSLRTEHAPKTATETLLVDRMAESFYMSSCAIALQSSALLSGDDTRLSLLLRYQTAHERAFFKSLNELAKLRKEKRQEQIGFESQERKQAAHEVKMRSMESRLRVQQLENDLAAIAREPLPQAILDVFAEYDAKALANQPAADPLVAPHTANEEAK